MPSEKTIPFPPQTARFGMVVKRSGSPAIYATFIPVQKDVALQRLDRQTKVMTVHLARRGTGADYGVVGLFKERGTQLLVFPRSLRRFAGKRIIGINYDLLEDASSVTGAVAEIPSRPRASKLRAKTKPQAADHATPPSDETVPVLPPTMAQVLARLQRVNRLLFSKKYHLARAEVIAMAECVRAGLKSAP